MSGAGPAGRSGEDRNGQGKATHNTLTTTRNTTACKRGGRIAIYFNTNAFAGIVSAHGGGGAGFGGAGTVYYKTNSQIFGLLVLDNANNAGTNTSFDFLNLDLTIQNHAVGLMPAVGAWAPHNLLIRTNGTLAAPASPGQRSINANSVTIDSGGSITMDGAGYGPQSGPGLGRNSSTLGGGGGYGPPSERDEAAIARDVLYGYITPAAAERDYGYKSANQSTPPSPAAGGRA